MARAQAIQEFHRDMRDSLLNPDEKMADIIHRAYACEPISVVEANIRRLYWERLIRTYENQWYQWREGLMDQDLYEGYQSYWRITVGWREVSGYWVALSLFFAGGEGTLLAVSSRSMLIALGGW